MDEKINYKKIFCDICEGYSITKHGSDSLYIKHISLSDHVSLDELRESFISEAKNRGLPTIEESLNNLKEEGYWTEKDELSLNQEEMFLEKIKDQKKHTYLKSQIEIFNKQIDDSLKKINNLKNKRNSLLGNTCENFADQRITEEFLKISLFKDKNLQKSYFTEEEFDYLSPESLSEYVIHYNNCINLITDYRIQKLVLEDFFTYYISYCEDPIHFFGKPVTNLSHNQLKLLLFARYFKNILANNDKIPEEYKKDPEKLIDYVTANQNAKDKIKDKENQATSLVGATSEDYKYINMDKKDSKKLSLSEEANKKGGSLDMNDLMKLMGM